MTFVAALANTRRRIQEKKAKEVELGDTKTSDPDNYASKSVNGNGGSNASVESQMNERDVSDSEISTSLNKTAEQQSLNLDSLPGVSGSSNVIKLFFCIHQLFCVDYF